MTLKEKKFKQIPNILTTIRILLIPLFVIFYVENLFIYKILALIVFIVASITDYIDGQIARKYKFITKTGKFLDPLADKLLVLTALFLFSFNSENHIPYWLILLIVVREIGITFLRIFAISKGSEVKTSFHGKLKTVSQIITIIVILVLNTLHSFILQYGIVKGMNSWQDAVGNFWGTLLDYLPLILVVIVVIITFYSGFAYIQSNRKIIK